MNGGRAPVDDLVAGVLAGDRAVLARALTLVESTRPQDEAAAAELLDRLLPKTGAAWRLGVSGPPGVGKSTFLDAFGSWLTARDHRVAVLAVDPSSRRSGGSILGDKARMHRLATDPRAFVRPSPSGGELGGVAARTREAVLVCEAAGFDVVFVETVGVGQSETLVADMVDAFLLLHQPASGDDLQAMKKGVLEMADLVVVNKADGELAPAAEAAVRQLSQVLRLLPSRHRAWRPRALAVSALTGRGFPELWEALHEHRRALTESGELEALRREQRLAWLERRLEAELLVRLRRHPGVAARWRELHDAVAAGRVTPSAAAHELLAAFFEDVR